MIHRRRLRRAASELANGKRYGCDILTGIIAPKHNPVDQPISAPRPIDLPCADSDFAAEMTRWLSHLRAERRLSPKTLEAYARDGRQCLTFLGEHWGALGTRPRRSNRDP